LKGLSATGRTENEKNQVLMGRIDEDFVKEFLYKFGNPAKLNYHEHKCEM